jgi:hypothetical protein
MGAVGRFTVDRRDDELLLDLKGVSLTLAIPHVSRCFGSHQ